jgi:anthranilate/para-aminobenzoate synthase component II
MKRLVLVALSVLGLCVASQSVALAQGGKAAKAMTVSGTVKSVSGTSLTITSGAKDMTFTIDGSTKFVGKGLSTKSAAGKITATDAVAMNDRVSVTYHDMGGTMHAASVRITNKAMTTKK